MDATRRWPMYAAAGALVALLAAAYAVGQQRVFSPMTISPTEVRPGTVIHVRFDHARVVERTLTFDRGDDVYFLRDNDWREVQMAEGESVWDIGLENLLPQFNLELPPEVPAGHYRVCTMSWGSYDALDDLAEASPEELCTGLTVR